MPRSLPSVLQGEDTVRLLALMQRERPATVAELRAGHPVPPARLDELLSALTEVGLLEVGDGGELELGSPTDVAAHRAEELAATTALIARVSRHDGRTRVGEHESLVERVCGRELSWQAWQRHRTAAPPRGPMSLYPSLDQLGADSPGAPPRVRVVLPRSVAEDPESLTQAAGLVPEGAEVRLAARVPSWVYVDPGVLAAVPLTWGATPDEGVVFVRDEGLTAVVAAYAEGVWQSARPWMQVTAPWTEVLRLMAAGLADVDIARVRGISVRAVERLVSDAMAHYDVESRFQLGAAFGELRTAAGTTARRLPVPVATSRRRGRGPRGLVRSQRL